jgi:hypothetical protein
MPSTTPPDFAAPQGYGIESGAASDKRSEANGEDTGSAADIEQGLGAT